MHLDELLDASLIMMHLQEYIRNKMLNQNYKFFHIVYLTKITWRVNNMGLFWARYNHALDTIFLFSVITFPEFCFGLLCLLYQKVLDIAAIRSCINLCSNYYARVCCVSCSGPKMVPKNLPILPCQWYFV